MRSVWIGARFVISTSTERISVDADFGIVEYGISMLVRFTTRAPPMMAVIRPRGGGADGGELCWGKLKLG